jgi:hypothetical protein
MVEAVMSMEPAAMRGDGGSRLGHIARGAVIGAVPGLVMIGINLLLVRGEAQLSVGVIGLMIAVVGVIAGAILGAQRDLRTRPMIVGITVGALPGLAMILVTTRLALPVLLVGVVAGGIIGGRRGQR